MRYRRAAWRHHRHCGQTEFRGLTYSSYTLTCLPQLLRHRGLLSLHPPWAFLAPWVRRARFIERSVLFVFGVTSGVALQVTFFFCVAMSLSPVPQRKKAAERATVEPKKHGKISVSIHLASSTRMHSHRRRVPQGRVTTLSVTWF